ncbi:Protein of unknown function [Bacillus wiedmannii]|nr:Protein of unknown function [Bacillus mobilis]SCN30118.1 Protein of unknown function [Bacillus wiedmannii]SCN30128.1 Protein of unknown function [Bacillus cereus]
MRDKVGMTSNGMSKIYEKDPE